MSAGWLGRHKWFFIIGVPVLGFVLVPFPIGICMIFPIVDTLRGHPEGPHGTQPAKFVGLWINEKAVKYDFRGQAFYLMSDGRLAGMNGMTSRRWHFDDGSLFVDAVSHCGNCYQGNVTSSYSVHFKDENHLTISNRDPNVSRGIGGHYERVDITAALKSEYEAMANSQDDDESFKGRNVLQVIEAFEARSAKSP